MDTRPAIDVDALLAHEGFVRRLARALVGSGPESDDVVQQTWLSALEHAPRQADVPRPWLATIVRNVVRQRRRADGRRSRRECAAARPESSPSCSSAASLEREALHRRAVAAVFALPEPLREAVVLRYFDALPPRRIAARLGVPVETVRTRVRRGIAAARARLDGDRRAWAGVLPLFGEGWTKAVRLRRWLPFALAAASVALVAVGIGFGRGPESFAHADAPRATPQGIEICSLNLGCAPVRAAPTARELDRTSITIREDHEPSRLVAEVTARATSDGERVAFELRASAVGPLVAGAPGPQGLHGGNRITAEELDALIARGGLVARLDGSAAVVVAKPGQSGRVVERVLSADGRVSHQPIGGRDGILDASFSFDGLTDGAHDVEIIADGRVRVGARVVVRGATARITRLKQITESGIETGP